MPKRVFFSLLLCSAAGSAMAGVRAFEAPADQASWRLERGAGACRLSQRVPLYGLAEFASRGNRQIEFSLSLERGEPEGSGWAIVRTVAPLWQPGVPSRELGSVAVQQGLRPFRLASPMAWRLLAELEQGMFPTFFLGGGDWRREQVTVALSAVNFLESYPRFLACIDALGQELRAAAEAAAREAAKPLDSVYAEDLPNRATLFFATDSAELTPSALEVLGKISDYLKKQAKIEVVVVDGHADDRGGNRANLKLSERRAEAVKSYLVGTTGVEPAKVRTRSYGEKFPAMPGDTPLGQARNRRALLLVQLPAPEEKDPSKQIHGAVELMNAVEAAKLGTQPAPAEAKPAEPVVESRPVVEEKH